MAVAEESVAAWWAAARAAWPGVAVPEAEWRRALGERVAAGVDEGELAANAADLYLAVACALGVPGAIRAFEAEHVARVPAWLARSEQDAAVIDEVRQRVRTKVLLGHGGEPPRIADYAARGPLGAWVRVVALREHATLRRGGAAHDVALDADALDGLARSSELTPELLALKGRYRELVGEAFRLALAALSPRARTLLRLFYVEEMSCEAIGRVYGVNKGTVSRWLSAARADVLDAARGHVRAELGAPAEDVESLLGLVKSGLDVSLHALLA